MTASDRETTYTQTNNYTQVQWSKIIPSSTKSFTHHTITQQTKGQSTNWCTCHSILCSKPPISKVVALKNSMFEMTFSRCSAMERTLSHSSRSKVSRQTNKMVRVYWTKFIKYKGILILSKLIKEQSSIWQIVNNSHNNKVLKWISWFNRESCSLKSNNRQLSKPK